MEGDRDRSVVIPLSTNTTTKKRRTRKKQRSKSSSSSDNKLFYLLFGIGCFSFCVTTILFVHLERDNPVSTIHDFKVASKNKFIPNRNQKLARTNFIVSNKQTRQKPNSNMELRVNNMQTEEKGRKPVGDKRERDIANGGNFEKRNAVISQNQNHNANIEKDNSKEKLVKILVDSGVNVSQEIEDKLPTWGEVQSLYGSKPLIVGLETCPNFQSIVPETDAYIGPSGIFNTGTNLLADLLLKYCILPKREVTQRQVVNFNSEEKRMKTGMLWHVPWGKHNPISWRTNHKASVGSAGVNQEHVLPVVVIKDPYHWMGSMCRHPYAAAWQHSRTKCPNLLSLRKRRDKKLLPNEVTVEYRKTNPGHYESLVGLWNDWYGDYFAIKDFPRLIIRFEDLLFHLEEVMTQVCHCGGGTLVNNKGGIKMQEKNAKEGHKNGSNGLLGAMLRYGHGDQRLEGFTKEEEAYARKTLRKDLMMNFGYTHPTND